MHVLRNSHDYTEMSNHCVSLDPIRCLWFRKILPSPHCLLFQPFAPLISDLLSLCIPPTPTLPTIFSIAGIYSPNPIHLSLPNSFFSVDLSLNYTYPKIYVFGKKNSPWSVVGDWGGGGGWSEKENKALTQSQDKTLSVDSPFPPSPFSNENSSADHWFRCFFPSFFQMVTFISYAWEGAVSWSIYIPGEDPLNEKTCAVWGVSCARLTIPSQSWFFRFVFVCLGNLQDIPNELKFRAAVVVGWYAIFWQDGRGKG